MDLLLKSILADFFSSFYNSFLFVLLLSVLFMFAYKYNKGLKSAFRQWLLWFRKEKKFRRVFYFAFYTALVLFRTLFSREITSAPLSNVTGGWHFWKIIKGKLVFYPSAAENLLMLAPFIFLLFLAFGARIFRRRPSILRAVWKSFIISFLFSCSIEASQLILHLGTFQWSDLVYNTLGGIIGGVAYYFFCVIVYKRRLKKSRHVQEVTRYEK